MPIERPILNSSTEQSLKVKNLWADFETIKTRFDDIVDGDGSQAEKSALLVRAYKITVCCDLP